MRKRKISFYGHISRMNNNGLTKKIFVFFKNREMKGNWFKQFQEDLNELGITDEITSNVLKLLKISSDESQRFQGKTISKRRMEVSEERRKAASDRKKEYQTKRKAATAHQNS